MVTVIINSRNYQHVLDVRQFLEVEDCRMVAWDRGQWRSIVHRAVKDVAIPESWKYEEEKERES